VIRNVGVIGGSSLLSVNVVAPFVLTAEMERPDRLIYLSSSRHRGGRADLAGVDWRGGQESHSCSDSKLFVTALAAAVARLWPEVNPHAVDPGWMPGWAAPAPATTSASATSRKPSSRQVLAQRRARAGATGITRRRRHRSQRCTTGIFQAALLDSLASDTGSLVEGEEATSTWAQTIARIAASDDLHIAPFRADGVTYGNADLDLASRRR
jgi:hypothetical protein